MKGINMAGTIRDVPFTVPVDLFRNCPGFGFDIGGSVVKFIYRSKADWQDVENNKDAQTGTLRMLTCGRPDLDAALESVLPVLHLTRHSNRQMQLYSCGIGGFIWNDKLQKALDARIENVVEYDCLVIGFKRMLRDCSVRELVYPPLKDDIQVVTKDMEEFAGLMRKWEENSIYKIAKGGNLRVDDEEGDYSKEEFGKTFPELYGEQDAYPHMLMMLGSAYFMLKIDKDGKPSTVEFSNRGGRTFIAMASHLTGCKSYDELIDLAEKGDHRKLNQTMGSLADGTNTITKEGDPYGEVVNIAHNNDAVVFFWGQAVFEDLASFRREDIAAALLRCHLNELCSLVHTAATAHKLRHCFVAGSLTNRAIVRSLMTREFTRRAMYRNIYMERPAVSPVLRFLRHGGHLGAYGTLIYSTEGYSVDPAASTQDSCANETNKATVDETSDI